MHADDHGTTPPGQILLATLDGAAYLQAQLDSIAAQDGVAWHLRVSDDGSRDATPDILQRFAADHPGRVTVSPGPRAGFVANFQSLIQSVDPSAPWVALCDQDDVWLPAKLRRATAWLGAQDASTPALYCSRQWVCGPDLEKRHLSPNYTRPPGFANALVENIATGNTIVLNRAAAALARDCAPEAADVFAHDWWLYLLVSGAGGAVHFDPEPGVLYRQHGRNQVGHGRRLRHIPQVMAGRYSDRVGRNIAALQAVRDRLTPAARATLAAFVAARDAPGPIQRVQGLARSGAYRQTQRGQLGLTVAMAAHRV